MTDLQSGDVGDEVGGGVDVAVGGGFEEAAGVDVVLAEQVGDGAGDLDEAIDAAGGERAALLDEVGEPASSRGARSGSAGRACSCPSRGT